MTTNTAPASELPLAVCVLFIRNVDGHCLAVSRRNDLTQWGLPGGKVDPGEDAITAAVREIGEETSIVVDPDKLVVIYRAVCPGDVTYDVITYVFDDPGPDIEDLKPEAGLTLKYCDISELCDPKNSPFADYNRGVLRAFAEKLVTEMKASRTS